MFANKYLSWFIKLATAAVCSYATYSVLAEPFQHIVILQVLAVALVEGVQLALWLEIERSASKPFATRAMLVIFAFGLYAGQWLIAWQHGEGAAGFIVRSAGGMALFASSYAVFVEAWHKANQRTDKSVQNNWRVRLYDRWLSVGEALAERSAQSAVRKAFLYANRAAGLYHAEKFAEYLKSGNADERLQSSAMAEWQHWTNSIGSVNSERQKAKKSAQNTMAVLLRDEPGISNFELAKRLELSESTVSRYRRELASQNGKG